MDEIITYTKLTWDAQSNDIFGFCANHPIDSYQFNTYLSLRRIKEAIDTGVIHTAKEKIVIIRSLLSGALLLSVLPKCCIWPQIRLRTSEKEPTIIWLNQTLAPTGQFIVNCVRLCTGLTIYQAYIY